MADPNSVSTKHILFSGDSSDGVVIGGASTALVGFHGVTAVAQATAITTVVSGTAATTATYGTPTPDLVNLITAVNSIITALHNKGLIG